METGRRWMTRTAGWIYGLVWLAMLVSGVEDVLGNPAPGRTQEALDLRWYGCGAFFLLAAEWSWRASLPGGARGAEGAEVAGPQAFSRGGAGLFLALMLIGMGLSLSLVHDAFALLVGPEGGFGLRAWPVLGLLPLPPGFALLALQALARWRELREAGQTTVLNKGP